MSAEKPRRLGRGLEALIPRAQAAANVDERSGDLQRIPLSRVRPNPYQPRREFDPAELAELQASLQTSGLLQPIVVRRHGDAFELIAGERRVRAATNLGWDEIAAIVREFDDRTMLVLALVENLQRANLNAIEEARGYRRLLDDFGLTQQQVAEAVGKDRTTVTNLLRMLSLPAEVLALVETGELSPGHARALLPVPANADSVALAKQAVRDTLTVRQLEAKVRELGASPTRRPEPAKAPGPAGTGYHSPVIKRIEDELRRFTQTDVHIQMTSPDTGKVQFSFYSQDDLERLLDVILPNFRKEL